MGGDEFTVIIGDIEHDGNVTEVAAKVLQAFAEPFMAGGRELHTTASVGIAIYPDDGTDFETLMKYADTAMYRVKDTAATPMSSTPPDFPHERKRNCLSSRAFATRSNAAAWSCTSTAGRPLLGKDHWSRGASAVATSHRNVVSGRLRADRRGDWADRSAR